MNIFAGMTDDTKQRVIDIISETFDDNAMINFIVKQDKHRSNRIRRLAEYAYNRCARRQGVYISQDGQGVALCYKFNQKGSWKDIIDQIKLVFGVIGVNRIREAQLREKFRNGIRQSDGNFLYFWFLGVSRKSEGMEAVKELRNRIFEESQKREIPIYLETTIPKNKKVYERYGFKTIHEWQVPNSEGITMWFMRREPNI